VSTDARIPLDGVHDRLRDWSLVIRADDDVAQVTLFHKMLGSTTAVVANDGLNGMLAAAHLVERVHGSDMKAMFINVFAALELPHMLVELA
jgi:hypothetical protein